MGKALHHSRLLWFLCCAGAMMMGACSPVNWGRGSPRVNQLVAESAKYKAVAESSLLNANPLLPGDVPEALQYIDTHADYTSYHLLHALRKYFPASYKEVAAADKVAILCSALKYSTYLNDWGSLAPSGSFDGDSAKALIETGQLAIRRLVLLLEDSDPAPLFGSKEATASKVYGYRRKDFAYRYTALILGRAPAFSADVRERDKAIETLKRNLMGKVK
jgi:hypothetical protein